MVKAVVMVAGVSGAMGTVMVVVFEEVAAAAMEAVTAVATVAAMAEAMAAATGRIAERLSEGRRFDLCRVKRVGQDVELTYRRVRTPGG